MYTVIGATIVAIIFIGWIVYEMVIAPIIIEEFHKNDKS